MIKSSLRHWHKVLHFNSVQNITEMKENNESQIIYAPKSNKNYNVISGNFLTV